MMMIEGGERVKSRWGNDGGELEIMSWRAHSLGASLIITRRLHLRRKRQRQGLESSTSVENDDHRLGMRGWLYTCSCKYSHAQSQIINDVFGVFGTFRVPQLCGAFVWP